MTEGLTGWADVALTVAGILATGGLSYGVMTGRVRALEADIMRHEKALEHQSEAFDAERVRQETFRVEMERRLAVLATRDDLRDGIREIRQLVAGAAGLRTGD